MKKTKKDKCVVCGKESIYDEDTHIDKRTCYVEGMGQVCLNCYLDTYEGV